MKPYGRLALFDREETVLDAERKLREERVDFDLLSAYEIEALFPDLPGPTLRRPDPVKISALFGALFGLVLGFGMQWYANVVDAPLDIGGRPFNSWPSFIPITFILMVLCSGLATVGSLFYVLRFPILYHPVQNAPEFDLSTQNFYILIRDESAHLPSDDFIRSLGAVLIRVVAC